MHLLLGGFIQLKVKTSPDLNQEKRGKKGKRFQKKKRLVRDHFDIFSDLFQCLWCSGTRIENGQIDQTNKKGTNKTKQNKTKQNKTKLTKLKRFFSFFFLHIFWANQ